MARPSTMIVHAPQTPCSHPTCVPVSRSSWRKKSTAVMRGSTAASTKAPFTRKPIRWVLNATSRPGRLRHGRVPFSPAPQLERADIRHSP